MWDSIHFTTKRSLLKYKIVLFYNYIFVPYRDMLKSDSLLLGGPRGELYKEMGVFECLLTTGSFCVNL